ncbi:hypothetical protein EI94DRAFT_1802529 [Lactarius quietus]|nr:hypothetical protein EI94DRAFT_1802529 [Lactarius quietus]
MADLFEPVRINGTSMVTVMARAARDTSVIHRGECYPDADRRAAARGVASSPPNAAATHLIPHHAPQSKSLVSGRLTPIANNIRRVLAHRGHLRASPSRIVWKR